MLKPSTYGGILNEEIDVSFNTMYIHTKLINLEVDSAKKDSMKAIYFDSRNQEMAKAYS